jgi:hypothetical protein
MFTYSFIHHQFSPIFPLNAVVLLAPVEVLASEGGRDGREGKREREREREREVQDEGKYIMMSIHKKGNMKNIFMTLYPESTLSSQLVSLPVLELPGATVVLAATPVVPEKRSQNQHEESFALRQSRYKINVCFLGHIIQQLWSGQHT